MEYTLIIILFAVSCDAPETGGTVHYSSYNSTLEGSNVIFWCTDGQLHTEAFTSVCHRNASWIPDPVGHCTTLRSGMNRNLPAYMQLTGKGPGRT